MTCAIIMLRDVADVANAFSYVIKLRVEDARIESEVAGNY